MLAGVEAAKQAGLKIKINTVALKGQNEEELNTFVAWCGAEGFDLTFIEVMPLGEIGGDTGNENRPAQFLPLSEVRHRLSQSWTLRQSAHQTGGSPAMLRWGKRANASGLSAP